MQIKGADKYPHNKIISLVIAGYFFIKMQRIQRYMPKETHAENSNTVIYKL